jgi:Cu/Ag efflux pump CusA
VLLTATVVAPAVVGGSRAGLEFLHPLAVTMLGGLVSLLLVQAFVLPAFLMVTAGQTSRPDTRHDVAPAPKPQHIA